MRLELTPYLFRSPVLCDKSVESIGKPGALCRGNAPARRGRGQKWLSGDARVIAQRPDDIASPSGSGEGVRCKRSILVSERSGERPLRRLPRAHVSDYLRKGLAQRRTHLSSPSP